MDDIDVRNHPEAAPALLSVRDRVSSTMWVDARGNTHIRVVVAPSRASQRDPEGPPGDL